MDWSQWQQLTQQQGAVWVAPWRRAITKPISLSSVKWPDALPAANAKIPAQAVAVDCKNLAINRQRLGSGWGQWRTPLADSASEALLVAVCSGVVAAGAP